MKTANSKVLSLTASLAVFILLVGCGLMQANLTPGQAIERSVSGISLAQIVASSQELGWPNDSVGLFNCRFISGSAVFCLTRLDFGTFTPANGEAVISDTPNGRQVRTVR